MCFFIANGDNHRNPQPNIIQILIDHRNQYLNGSICIAALESMIQGTLWKRRWEDSNNHNTRKPAVKQVY